MNGGYEVQNDVINIIKGTNSLRRDNLAIMKFSHSCDCPSHFIFYL